MIQSREEMNAIVHEFKLAFAYIYNRAFPSSPDNNEIASLLSTYHILIAPYIAQADPELLRILESWSAGNLENGRNIVEIYTEDDNGIELSYLWGLKLDGDIASRFARKLQASQDYDQSLLPPALKPYLEEKDSEVKLS